MNDIDISRLIFIDETCAKTNMTRRYGRSPRWQRLIDKTPRGHWMTTTLIGAWIAMACGVRRRWMAR